MNDRILFHDRTYEDPSRADETYHCASVILASLDGKEWTVTECMPGCMPDGEPMSFKTPAEAIAYAWESSTLDYPALFRMHYNAAGCRLSGRIQEAMRFEDALGIWIDNNTTEEGEPAGLCHVQDIAVECARSMLSVNLFKVKG
jgi:hypothetical protein